MQNNNSEKPNIDEGQRTLQFHVGFFAFRIIVAIIVIILMIKFSIQNGKVGGKDKVTTPIDTDDLPVP